MAMKYQTIAPLKRVTAVVLLKGDCWDFPVFAALTTDGQPEILLLDGAGRILPLPKGARIKTGWTLPALDVPPHSAAWVPENGQRDTEV